MEAEFHAVDRLDGCMEFKEVLSTACNVFDAFKRKHVLGILRTFSDERRVLIRKGLVSSESMWNFISQ